MTGRQLNVAAQRSIANNSFGRNESMDEARCLAQALVGSGKIDTIADLIRRGLFPGNVVGSIWANASFRGSNRAFMAVERGKPFAKPGFSVQITVGDLERSLDGELELEHYYSSSSTGYLSGRKQAFFIGNFDLGKQSGRGVIYPWLIGDLLEIVDVESSLQLSWGYQSNVYPGSIDAFAQMVNVRPPSESSLNAIMNRIPESDLKKAFAEIIGEPFVPKDWAGERSDLYTSRITIDKIPLSAAFLLKGPSVRGPMHVADLGKRGDQVVRLFDEPAELLILQHCHKVETTVVKTMRAFAIDPERPRKYCIIDGASTYSILRAYGYLTTSGDFQSPKVQKAPKVRQRMSKRDLS